MRIIKKSVDYDPRVGSSLGEMLFFDLEDTSGQRQTNRVVSVRQRRLLVQILVVEINKIQKMQSYIF